MNKPYVIMVQGTMSSAGKSLIAAGLCRIFKEDGWKVAPFKSQNMALNSYVTEDGLEMGRAQVMQAEAAGIKPSVYMNPILLKPTDDCGSQVIVNGRVIGNMRAREYFAYKKELIPDIKSALEKLSEQVDIIVIEGAGSPAEINLKENDIVNMGMAKIADAPVLLVGDIDRGGVFAQLLGTLELLEEDEKDRVKGLIVNKFRGDKTILDPGIDMLEERGHVHVVGVVPYMNVNLEDEDSLTTRFDNKGQRGIINIDIVRLPHISNFTDFAVFDEIPEVNIRYITSPQKIMDTDMLIIPGSKNTIADMRWMIENGMEAYINKLAARDIPIMGICGGYQMLGNMIEDPDESEAGGRIRGLGLLPVATRILSKKVRKQTFGSVVDATGIFTELKGKKYSGYEIHMGETIAQEEICPFTENMTGFCKANIYGTYIHGIFDDDSIVKGIVNALSKKKGIEPKLDNVISYSKYKETQFDELARILREHLDMNAIYEMMGITDVKK